MSIASEIQTLVANKIAIKNAILAKSPATPPGDNLSDWPTSIGSIPSGSDGFPIDNLLQASTEPQDIVINCLSASRPSGTLENGLLQSRNFANIRSISFVTPNLSADNYSLRCFAKGLTTLTSVGEIDPYRIGTYGMLEMFAECTNLVSCDFTGFNPQLFGSRAVSRMFYNCRSLVEMPKMWTAVNSSTGNDRYFSEGTFSETFSGCTSLQPDGVRNWLASIPIRSVSAGSFYKTFFGCTNLTGEMVIPMSGYNNWTPTSSCFEGMFQSCPNLTKVVLDFTHHTAVPVLGGINYINVFNSISDTRLEIRVPASLEATWKTASNWSTYANMIVGV